MDKIIESSELPEGEKVYLRKDAFGWRTIEPWKVDNKINWYNLITGGTRNLVFLIFFLLIIATFLIGMNIIIQDMKDVAARPCDYCNQEEAYTTGLTFDEVEFEGVDYG